jgi:site-specific recombinase XerD
MTSSSQSPPIPREILTSVGIKKKVGFHTGRHTFATLKLQKGTDLATISKLLGHKDIGSTMVYLKMNDNKLLDIHEEIGKSFLSMPETKTRKCA